MPPPPPPPTRSRALRTGLIVGAVVVLAAAGGIGWYLSSSGGGSSAHRVSAPQSFAGYTRLTNSTAKGLESSMRSLGETAGGGAAKRIFDAATIGVYAKNSGDQPVLISLALPTKAADSSESADEITSQLLQGAVTNGTAYSSGSHGGVTRCGTAQFGAAAETMCAWSDPKTSGVLVSVNPPVSPAALASVSVAFRDDVE
jgi:hypothetical protein